MRKVLGSLTAAAALLALPHLAQAQRAGASAAKNEIGVDLGAAYSHTGSGCATDCGSFGVGTPVDVRWGFLAHGPVSFEPRFTFSYLTGGGGHVLSFDPDVNLLYRLGGSTSRHGPYLTSGLGLAVANASGGGTSNTATQFSLNGGVGTRIPMESSAAWRVEGFLRYNFENTGKGIPSSYNIGARFGMSFWR